MNGPRNASPIGSRRLLSRGVVALMALLLVSGTAFAACSGATGTPMATMAATPAGSMTPATSAGTVGSAADELMPADANAAWDARPDYVKGNPQTEEAYAWALYHPSVLQWMPCYCGCAAMDHGSNRDCYYKKAVPGQSTTFEEHASYCDVCVKITLKTKQLLSEGKSLSEIRAAIDQEFKGSVPGTPTALPPA
jgi:hypothetical protein